MRCGRFALLAAAPLLAASALQAEPTWWAEFTEIPTLTAQTGKGVVLYFETERAQDCVRLNELTWPAIPAVIADENFVWSRLNPAEHSSFFKHYEVLVTPEIVILDSHLKERDRIRGFISPEDLMIRIKKVPRGKPRVQTTTDGSAIDAGQTKKAAAHRASMAGAGHFFFETFDSYKSLQSIRSAAFQPVLPADSRIESTAGIYGSPCLVVDSGAGTSAIIRIDVSRGLDKVAQLLGRIRVRTRLRALKLGEDAENVGALTIVEAGQSVNSPSAKRGFITLANRHQNFYEREIVSEPFHFRNAKAYLTFQVNWPGYSFCVDDLRVDLLPVSDSIASAPAAPRGALDSASALLPPTEPELFRIFDKNGDGRITRAEIGDAEGINDLFTRLDTNSDDVVTLNESLRLGEVFGRPGSGRNRNP